MVIDVRACTSGRYNSGVAVLNWPITLHSGMSTMSGPGRLTPDEFELLWPRDAGGVSPPGTITICGGSIGSSGSAAVQVTIYSQLE